MARIRSLHPEQWTDDKFVTCSPLARLLAIGIRNWSDDNGVFEWNPVKLKMRILPADNCDVVMLLEELIETDQVLRYTIDGKEYGLIRSFCKHQRPKKPTFHHPYPAFDLNRGYEPHATYVRDSYPLVGNQFGKSQTDGEKSREEKSSKKTKAKKTETTKRKSEKFIPPTLQQVADYCAMRKNKIDPEYFVDHYIARDWKLKSGQKMSCWKACIRTWEKNNFNSGGDKNVGKQKSAVDSVRAANNMDGVIDEKEVIDITTDSELVINL